MLRNHVERFNRITFFPYFATINKIALLAIAPAPAHSQRGSAIRVLCATHRTAGLLLYTREALCFLDVSILCHLCTVTYSFPPLPTRLASKIQFRPLYLLRVDFSYVAQSL